MEAIAEYLRDELQFRYCQIASLLNRDDRTIWGAHKSANEKSNGNNFSVEESTVKIKQEIISTGEHLKCTSRKIIALPNATTSIDLTWAYNISVISLSFTMTEENRGDSVICTVAPDTTIGIITQNIGTSDTVITVSQTVIDTIKVGYIAKLYNGTTQKDLGEVRSINTEAKTITITTPTDCEFLSSTPTYVQMEVRMFENYEFGNPRIFNVGETSPIGGSPIPANTIVRGSYINTSGVTKTFIFYIYYFY